MKKKTTRRGSSAPKPITPPAIYVQKAGDKGRGVFANAPFKKGSVIEIAPVLLVPLLDYPAISNTFLSDYMFAVGDTEYSAIALGYASLYNHCQFPTADYTLTGNVVIITAIADIGANDEITLNYGWDPTKR